MDVDLSRDDLLDRIKDLEDQLTFSKVYNEENAEDSLRKYARRLRGLNVIGQAILSARLPEETARAVLKHIRLIVPCSRASVNLFDFDKGQFVALAAIYKGISRFRSGINLPLDSLRDDLQLLKNGEIVHVTDTNRLVNPSLHIKNLLQEGLRTYLYIPLISNDYLIGSLNLGENFPDAFSDEHIQIALELANIMAIAIEQARLFKRNSEKSKQLRHLAARLTEAEDLEKKRLARELHDQVGQNLTAININMNVIRSQLPDDVEAGLLERLDDTLKLLEETTSHVRGVMVELRPQVIDDYGLVAALHWYGQQFSKRTGINVRVDGVDLYPRLALSVEMTFFRIVQEALNNVVKHAQASQIIINVKKIDGKISLKLSDNGKGFQLDSSSGMDQLHSGMGIVTMQERAMGIGAKFNIDTKSGYGTSISIVL